MGWNGIGWDRDLPNPGWISRDPAFGETDQLGAVRGGFGDEDACLVDGGVEVEPDGLGLGDGDADGGWVGGCCHVGGGYQGI